MTSRQLSVPQGGRHRMHTVLKNRVPQLIEDAVVALAIEQPAFGQVRVACNFDGFPNDPKRQSSDVRLLPVS
jgi:hypothetical protein